MLPVASFGSRDVYTIHTLARAHVRNARRRTDTGERRGPPWSPRKRSTAPCPDRASSVCRLALAEARGNGRKENSQPTDATTSTALASATALAAAPFGSSTMRCACPDCPRFGRCRSDRQLVHVSISKTGRRPPQVLYKIQVALQRQRRHRRSRLVTASRPDSYNALRTLLGVILVLACSARRGRAVVAKICDPVGVCETRPASAWAVGGVRRHTLAEVVMCAVRGWRICVRVQPQRGAA